MPEVSIALGALIDDGAERLRQSGIGFDRLHRAIAKQVGHVAVAVDRDLLLMEWRPRLAAVIEIVRGAAPDAEEVVVAALERAEIRQEAQMPLADKCRAIASFLE